MRIPATLAAALFIGICCAQRPADRLFQEALASAKAGDLDSARAQVDRSLAYEQNNAKALKLSGDLHQRAREVDAALADYKASEALDPNNARLYISRGALRISENQLKTALKDCERAVELDPTDPDGYYNRACALYLSGNVEAALKDAEKAVKLDPQHADALYLSGISKGELYKEEEGMADIDAALKLKPGIPGARMSMAILLYESERYDEAIDKFTEVIANDTNELAVAYYYRGDCYYNKRNKEKACEDFKQSMSLGDRDAAFIKKNYCDTDLDKIPKKPVKRNHRSTIQF